MPQHDEFIRTVRYYCMETVLNKGNGETERGFYAPSSWQDNFITFKSLAFNRRWFDGVVYEVHSTKNSVTFGMHRPLDSKFITEIDREGGSVQDYANSNEDHDRLLANATAVAVKEISGRIVVAVAQSNGQQSPTHKAVERLFEKIFAPLDSPSNYHWEARGIIEDADVEKLSKADGVTMLEGSFIAHPDAMISLGPMQNILDTIGNAVGYEVEVKMKLQIKPSKSSDPGPKNMLSLVWDARRTNQFTGKKIPKVEVATAEGTEILELAQHKFATKAYLDVNDVIGVNFSSLLNKVMEELDNNTERIESILARPQRN